MEFPDGSIFRIFLLLINFIFHNGGPRCRQECSNLRIFIYRTQNGRKKNSHTVRAINMNEESREDGPGTRDSKILFLRIDIVISSTNSGRGLHRTGRFVYSIFQCFKSQPEMRKGRDDMELGQSFEVFQQTDSPESPELSSQLFIRCNLITSREILKLILATPF